MTQLLRTWTVRMMLLCLAVGGLVGGAAARGFCGTQTSADVEAKVLLKVHSQKTLIRGPRSAAGEWVIRDEAAWQKFWGRAAIPADIEVDFRTQMVLIIAEGRGGRGKYLSFAEVVDTGEEIQATLHYQISLRLQLQDLVWPCHFIVVDRSAKPVRFASRVINDLGDLLQPARGARPQPKLTFAIDGKDLLVSATIVANNSPHALSTSYRHDKAGKTVALRYCLIQNSDLLVRSQKKVRVTWRLVGLAAVPRGDIRCHVEPTEILLNTAELGQMMPQLGALHQEGVQWNKVKGAK